MIEIQEKGKGFEVQEANASAGISKICGIKTSEEKEKERIARVSEEILRSVFRR